MQDIIKNNISELAKQVQNESLSFGCASALYGLTKLFYDIDRNAFDDLHAARLSELKSKCQEAVLYGEQTIYDEAIEEIEVLQKAKDNIALKFFYIKFYDIPPAIQQKAELEKLHFGARLDTPDVFKSQSSVGSSDIWDNIYLITIPSDIMNRICSLDDDEWSEERKDAKEKQRQLTAHEMAHQIFQRFDPDGSLGMDTDENAELFAIELLRYREYYINGSPSFPRIKLDHVKLTSELSQLFNNHLQVELADKIANTLPTWLEFQS